MSGGGNPRRRSQRREWHLPAAFSPYFPARDVISDSATQYPRMREIKRQHSARKVFLDVPYDDEFLQTLLPAVVTSCWALGLEPFRLSEDVGTGPRLKRLADHLLQSHFVVSDLSRTQRMNMPFELGIAIGFGRSCAVLVDDQNRLLRDFSDLRGLDLLEHGGQPKTAVRKLCAWFKPQFQQRRWPVKMSVPVDRLVAIVEPSIRAFFVERAEDHLSLEELRQALAALWNTVDVGYLEEFAHAHHLPFEEKVAQHRIATMREFFAVER